jgi:hypothetical protein
MHRAGPPFPPLKIMSNQALLEVSLRETFGHSRSEDWFRVSDTGSRTRGRVEFVRIDRQALRAKSNQIGTPMLAIENQPVEGPFAHDLISSSDDE